MGSSRIKYNLKIFELNREIQISQECLQVHIFLVGLWFNACGHCIFCRELQLSSLGDPRSLASRIRNVLCYVLIDVSLSLILTISQECSLNKSWPFFLYSVPENLVRYSRAYSAKLKRRYNIFTWLKCRGMLGKETVFNLLLLIAAGQIFPQISKKNVVFWFWDCNPS